MTTVGAGRHRRAGIPRFELGETPRVTVRTMALESLISYAVVTSSSPAP